MANVFDDLGGFRPMAAQLGVPPSTVLSWCRKGIIPVWRHEAILKLAEERNVALTSDDLFALKPQPARRPNRRREASSQDAAA